MKKVDKEFISKYPDTRLHKDVFQTRYYEDCGGHYLIKHKWNLLSKIVSIIIMPFVGLYFAGIGFINGVHEALSPFRDGAQSGSFIVQKKGNKDE